MPIVFDLFTSLVVIGVSAYSFSTILTDPDMILGRPYAWLAEHLPMWLFKPLIGCYRCVTGQWAFWWYLISYYYDYNFLIHMGFVLCAIYVSDLLNYVWLKANS